MITGVFFTVIWNIIGYESLISARAMTFFVSLLVAVAAAVCTQPRKD